MSNRLPPAWAKHLKAQSVPKPGFQGGKFQPKPYLSPERADDVLLKQALECQQQQQPQKAEELCHRVLARTPEHPLALYILGTLGLASSSDTDSDLAVSYFMRAASQDPGNPYYQFSLGTALLKVGNYRQAIVHLERAFELKPDMTESLCELGRAYVASGKALLALPLYDKVLKTDINHPTARIGLAAALSSLGRMGEARTCLKVSIDRRLNIGLAYNDFVHTQKFAEEPAELASIKNELSRAGLDADTSRRLHHAAGKVLNDLKRYREAMDHFHRAKIAGGYKFDLDAYRRLIDTLISVFDEEIVASKADQGDPSEMPVFVLGMPRSGTTLTEQICASHPAVYGAGELTKMRRIANALGMRTRSRSAVAESVNAMSVPQARGFAREYLAELGPRDPAVSRTTDKMPHNFELIGLIKILFPNARIIHCRRDAVDTCLSCFVSNFNEGHGYVADFKTLGLYYREYDRLMRHWRAVFPGQIFENTYETLIADQETQSRRLIEYLGLPWDDACLRFFDRSGSVNTPSRWQVRQPIYASSVKRWKNYENEIQPLIEALGDLADT